jgi:hypothetical protein
MSFLQHLLKTLPEASKWIVFDGLQYKSEAQIYDTILQLEEDLLRPLSATGKQGGATFKLLTAIKDILYQAGEAHNIVERLQERIEHERSLARFFEQQYLRAQQQLLRFETIEDMEREGTLELAMERVRKVMQEKMAYDLKLAEELRKQK